MGGRRQADRRASGRDVSDELDDVLVFAFPKNKGSEYRAQLRTWEGHRIADLRLHVRNKDGELVPTAKGIAVRATDQLRELKCAVDALIEEFEREQSA